MDSEAILLILGIPLGYGVLLIGLAVLVRPLRREMVIIAESLLADKSLSKADRASISTLLDTSVSFRVGLVLPLAAIGVMIDDILRRPTSHTRVERDPRYHALVARYFVSILAANPLFAMVSIPLMLVGSIVHPMGRGNHRVLDVVESPVVRASSAGIPRGMQTI